MMTATLKSFQDFLKKLNIYKGVSPRRMRVNVENKIVNR